MKRQAFLFFITLSLSGQALVAPAMADTFGSGANTFDIEFVTIGNPGNVGDTTGNPNPAGAVNYDYRMGKFEISEQMIDKANALGGLGLTKDTRGPNKPATSLSWFEAARFVNWLNTSTGHAPAYKFDGVGNFQMWQPNDAGYDSANLFRNSLAWYFLPSTNEWYKGAFYDPATGNYWDYPTGSNDPPTPVASGTAPGTAVWNQPGEQGPADVNLAGGLSPYGTMGQGGNVWEWEETELDLVNNSLFGSRGVRGDNWLPSLSPLGLSSNFRNHSFPEANPINGGIRVASVVPEPATLWLAMLGYLVISLRLRRRAAMLRGFEH